MAYELGAGLGIALFGLILTRSYSASIALPSGLSGAMAQQAASSIGEAVSLSGAARRGGAGADGGGEDGFIQAHSGAGDGGCIASAAGRWDLAQPRHRGETAVGAIAAATDPSPRAVAGEAFSFNAAALTVAAGTPTFRAATT